VTLSPGRPLPAGAETVPFRVAFAYWVRLGFVSFGGPAGQIAIMHRDLVDNRRWISEERFLHALNYCMLLPGPEAQQLAIYIGWLMHGTRGGIAAGAFFVIPSIVILWSLSAVYAFWGQVPAVAGLLAGLKPVVVALVLAAVLRIGRSAFRPRGLIAIAAAAFAAIFLAHVPFPIVILGAALVGAAAARLWPRSFERAEAGAEGRLPPAATDSEEVRRRVADSASWPRAFRILAIGVALWAVPFWIVRTAWGAGSVFDQEYRFFTKAALVTFGGAYSVLAYVTQAAVESFRWISHAQAVDGLGLAETTPGPLVMVLQFVGFLAAWNHPETAAPLASATLGALLTTWVTFLPCFVFVFLGAPYIDFLRTLSVLSAAMKGVTAAVVGIILNLAVVFGIAVLLPSGAGGPLDPFAAVVTLVAFAVLLFSRIEAIWVVLGGAAFGLAFRLLAHVGP
jgi:chromate transporter